MEVNTQIYGASTTWSRDDGFSYAAVPDAYAFKKGQCDTLKDYVNANKLSIGQQIDYSICYAGMASDLPLSKLKTWVVLQDGDNVNNYIIQMYSRNEPTGWFFGHGENFASTYAEIYGSPILLDNRPDALYRIADYYWIPDGQLTETTYQVSQNITPIVEFNPHSCYFGINVEVFNRQTGNFATYYLDEMHGHTFSAYEVITRAWGELWTRRGDTDTDYAAAGTYCGVCPDRLIDFGSNAIPYLSYAYNLNHHFPLFGWLDTQPVKEQLYHMVSTMESGTVELQPHRIDPEVRKEDLIKNYMLRSSVYTPIDKHSTENRNQNIQHAFDFINGYVLEPGKTFSFNNVVGERTEAMGIPSCYRICLR